MQLNWVPQIKTYDKSKTEWKTIPIPNKENEAHMNLFVRKKMKLSKYWSLSISILFFPWDDYLGSFLPSFAPPPLSSEALHVKWTSVVSFKGN